MTYAEQLRRARQADLDWRRAHPVKARAFDAEKARQLSELRARMAGPIP